MPSVETYTAAGAKSTAKINLDKNTFGVDVPNHETLKAAYTAYLANGRTNLAKTKNRGEVSGSTKKPWKQKGTGRARFGSKYGPIWRGGGVAFGPTGKENYSKKITTAAKRLAIRQSLSLSAKDGNIKVVDNFDAKDGKTKTAAKLIAKLDLNGRILIVVSDKTEGVVRATGNLEDVKLIQPQYLNSFDILNADSILISKDSLGIIEQWLATPTKKEKAEK